MALLCYNKGCGQRFALERNSPDACLHHPGVPIFHDALKGCTRGYHSNEKPPELNETLAEAKVKVSTEVVVQGPKSAEVMQRERPSPDEPKQLLPVKVSRSLEQALEKLSLSRKEQPSALVPPGAGAALETSVGTTCKNSGCTAAYQGEESDSQICTFHPGVPVFHEGMKYWSCCGIKTTDFSAFLEQKGCSKGKHSWVKHQQPDKQRLACRQDWHQTGGQVVVTVYAKSPLPDRSSVKANRTGLDTHVVFEGDKVFQEELELWGVIDVGQSFVNMAPSKVEIVLKKASPIPWASLEHPQSRGEAPWQQQGLQPDASGGQEAGGALQEESDDSLDWSEEDDEQWGAEAEQSPLQPQPSCERGAAMPGHPSGP
ncbi:Cysteine and histidine-rich domain-containing protein 1 [Varanus komodoensis]|nr:Cysteine and histidine-rich domain-containing protein 1 [Varanus komodoensis]